MSLDEKPWLTRKFRDGRRYAMPVAYILEHIEGSQRYRTDPGSKDCWTLSKEPRVERVLDSGVPPERMDPISLALHPYREEFAVNDGVTRLRVYRKRGIETIAVKLYRGVDWK